MSQEKDVKKKFNRLYKLALPHIYIVEAVLRDQSHIINENFRERLKRLLEVILEANNRNPKMKEPRRVLDEKEIEVPHETMKEEGHGDFKENEDSIEDSSLSNNFATHETKEEGDGDFKEKDGDNEDRLERARMLREVINATYYQEMDLPKPRVKRCKIQNVARRPDYSINQELKHPKTPVGDCKVQNFAQKPDYSCAKEVEHPKTSVGDCKIQYIAQKSDYSCIQEIERSKTSVGDWKVENIVQKPDYSCDQEIEPPKPLLSDFKAQNIPYRPDYASTFRMKPVSNKKIPRKPKEKKKDSVGVIKSAVNFESNSIMNLAPNFTPVERPYISDLIMKCYKMMIREIENNWDVYDEFTKELVQPREWYKHQHVKEVYKFWLEYLFYIKHTTDYIESYIKKLLVMHIKYKKNDPKLKKIQTEIATILIESMKKIKFWKEVLPETVDCCRYLNKLDTNNETAIDVERLYMRYYQKSNHYVNYKSNH